MVVEDLVDPEYLKVLEAEVARLKETTEAGGKNWICPMWNSLETADIKNSTTFCSLATAVETAVAAYVKQHGSDYPYPVKDMWVNSGLERDYQEFHTHPGSTISACFYVSMPEGSGDIIFQSPTEPDMLPIRGITSFNDLSFKTARYHPKAGTLVVWRSYLWHAVEAGTNKTPRVTIAFNF